MDVERLIQIVILVGAGLSFLWGKKQEDARKAKPRVESGVKRPAPGTPARKGGLDALFENLQAELERASDVEQGPRRSGPMGRAATRRMETAEEVEERETLEGESRVVSMEAAPNRAARVLVDYDDQSASVSRQRVEAAQAQNRALDQTDHDAFDKRIRGGGLSMPATAGASRPTFAVTSLRQAVIWQEILSPPVSERPAGMSER